MDIVTLDFETYYDREYSLSKMTTEAYIRDPRFEVIGVALKINNRETDWYSGKDVGGFLNSIDYSDKAILAHNTAFDGAILSWHYGIKPRLWLDTLSMARPLVGMYVGVGLAALAAYYGIGEKGDEIQRTIGMRRTDFTPHQMKAFANYAIQDVELTRTLFKVMSKGFPVSELRIIDLMLRMYTEPTLELDPVVLDAHLDGILTKKKLLLDKLGGEDKAKKTLMSNNKFAELLRALGVTPPMKTSPTTGKQTYAFAKNDRQFLGLLEHPRPAVRAVVEARLGTKSTIEETRTNRFIDMSGRGALPVMLRYYGAHTGRASGGDKINLQNLPRGGALRKAIIAPDGHVIVSADSGQIEARTLAYVAGQDDLVEAFREGRDVYSEFATDIYGRPVSRDTPVERHVGKTGILGLGFGVGRFTLQNSLATGKPAVEMSEGEAQEVVTLYRNKYHKIPAYWRKCGRALDGMVAGASGNICDLLPYDENGIRLPNGLYITYPQLRRTMNGHEYLNTPMAYQKFMKEKLTGGNPKPLTWTNIYGGKVTENVVQAVARIIVAEQMVTIAERYPVVLQVHDENVCVVPEDQAEECAAFMGEVMSQSPTFAPDLPLSCEVGIGINYGET